MTHHQPIRAKPAPVPPSKGAQTPSCASSTRVTKRMLPTQQGALKLARRYGEALVCVRYRHDEQRHLRYTTVELVVDQAPSARRIRPEEPVMVHIDFDDASLQHLAQARGARWDERRRLWHMTHGLASALKLTAAILPPGRLKQR